MEKGLLGSLMGEAQIPKCPSRRRRSHWEMSYGAPWERGISAADTMPQRNLEVPGLVPDVGGVKLNMKEARRHRCQRGRRQRRREEKASRKARSKEDEGRCLDVLAGAVEENCRGLSVVLCGLDLWLCESTPQSATTCIASVYAWVVGAIRVGAGWYDRACDGQVDRGNGEHLGVTTRASGQGEGMLGRAGSGYPHYLGSS